MASPHTATYEGVGRLFGRDNIRRLSLFLSTSGVRTSPEAFAGLFAIATSLMAVSAAILSLAFVPARDIFFKLGLLLLKPLVVNLPFFVPVLAVVLSLVGVSGLITLMVYTALVLSADERRNKVEDVLPDFLVLAAANVRAGMTIDQALWYAAKPEFGLLSAEMQVVAKRTFGGVPFNQSIDHIADKFNSRSMRRCVALIKQGLASGGEIAEILERTADDSRNMQLIRKEIAASLLMYIIFIVFAAAVGTPFLFSVSTQLIQTLETVFTQLPDTAQLSATSSPAAGMSVVRLQPPIVSSTEFFYFMLLAGFITCTFSSLMIGVIQKGSKREGLKYLPFMMVSNVVIFFIVSTLLSGFLKSLGHM